LTLADGRARADDDYEHLERARIGIWNFCDRRMEEEEELPILGVRLYQIWFRSVVSVHTTATVSPTSTMESALSRGSHPWKF